MATQTQLEQETAAMIASMTEDQLLQFGEEEIVKGSTDDVDEDVGCRECELH